MSAKSTLGTIENAIEAVANEAAVAGIDAIEGAPKPAPTPVAAPAAIASQDVGKFAAALLAWLGRQEPTIIAGLSIADTLTKFVAVFVPGAEAVDLGIEMAETDIPIVYNVGTAALPFVRDLESASAAFAPAPPEILGAPRATGLV